MPILGQHTQPYYDQVAVTDSTLDDSSSGSIADNRHTFHYQLRNFGRRLKPKFHPFWDITEERQSTPSPSEETHLVPLTPISRRPRRKKKKSIKQKMSSSMGSSTGDVCYGAPPRPPPPNGNSLPSTPQLPYRCPPYQYQSYEQIATNHHPQFYPSYDDSVIKPPLMPNQRCEVFPNYDYVQKGKDTIGDANAHYGSLQQLTGAGPKISNGRIPYQYGSCGCLCHESDRRSVSSSNASRVHPSQQRLFYDPAQKQIPYWYPQLWYNRMTNSWCYGSDVSSMAPLAEAPPPPPPPRRHQLQSNGSTSFREQHPGLQSAPRQLHVPNHLPRSFPQNAHSAQPISRPPALSPSLSPPSRSVGNQTFFRQVSEGFPDESISRLADRYDHVDRQSCADSTLTRLAYKYCSKRGLSTGEDVIEPIGPVVYAAGMRVVPTKQLDTPRPPTGSDEEVEDINRGTDTKPYETERIDIQEYSSEFKQTEKTQESIFQKRLYQPAPRPFSNRLSFYENLNVEATGPSLSPAIVKANKNQEFNAADATKALDSVLDELKETYDKLEKLTALKDELRDGRNMDYVREWIQKEHLSKNATDEPGKQLVPSGIAHSKIMETPGKTCFSEYVALTSPTIRTSGKPKQHFFNAEKLSMPSKTEDIARFVPFERQVSKPEPSISSSSDSDYDNMDNSGFVPPKANSQCHFKSTPQLSHDYDRPIGLRSISSAKDLHVDVSCIRQGANEPFNMTSSARNVSDVCPDSVLRGTKSQGSLRDEISEGQRQMRNSVSKLVSLFERNDPKKYRQNEKDEPGSKVNYCTCPEPNIQPFSQSTPSLNLASTQNTTSCKNDGARISSKICTPRMVKQKHEAKKISKVETEANIILRKPLRQTSFTSNSGLERQRPASMHEIRVSNKNPEKSAAIASRLISNPTVGSTKSLIQTSKAPRSSDVIKTGNQSVWPMVYETKSKPQIPNKPVWSKPEYPQLSKKTPLQTTQLRIQLKQDQDFSNTSIPDNNLTSRSGNKSGTYYSVEHMNAPQAQTEQKGMKRRSLVLNRVQNFEKILHESKLSPWRSSTAAQHCDANQNSSIEALTETSAATSGYFSAQSFSTEGRSMSTTSKPGLTQSLSYQCYS